jgi:hypothetical protein
MLERGEHELPTLGVDVAGERRVARPDEICGLNPARESSAT